MRFRYINPRFLRSGFSRSCSDRRSSDLSSLWSPLELVLSSKSVWWALCNSLLPRYGPFRSLFPVDLDVELPSLLVISLFCDILLHLLPLLFNFLFPLIPLYLSRVNLLGLNFFNRDHIIPLIKRLILLGVDLLINIHDLIKSIIADPHDGWIRFPFFFLLWLYQIVFYSRFNSRKPLFSVSFDPLLFSLVFWDLALLVLLLLFNSFPFDVFNLFLSLFALCKHPSFLLQLSLFLIVPMFFSF